MMRGVSTEQQRDAEGETRRRGPRRCSSSAEWHGNNRRELSAEAANEEKCTCCVSLLPLPVEVVVWLLGRLAAGLGAFDVSVEG